MAEEIKKTQENEITEEQRRKIRHSNRIKSQVAAYLTLVLIALVIFGCVTYIVHYFKGQQPQPQGSGYIAGTELPETEPPVPEEETQTADALEELLGQEEELTAPDPEVVDAEPAPTEDELLNDLVNAAIEVMPLEDKISGLFFTTPESITGVTAAVKAGDGTRKALEKYTVGGIVYASKNIQSQAQFAEMLNTTQSLVTYPTFLGVIEEGGKVSSVTNSGIGTKVDSAETIGQSGLVDTAYNAGQSLGATLISLGLDVDFAPVADLGVIDNSVMAGRYYGSDPEQTASFVNAMVSGLDSQNVTACIKSFPSKAASTQDPEKTRATSDRSLEDLRANEFLVYQSAIENGVRMIQISNVIFEKLDENNIPCSLSAPVVTDLLRTELGYNGVIISGSLSDKAITDYYGSDEAAVMALKAGCDMLYCPENFEKAYQGILNAVNEGVISESRIDDALRRIYRIKYQDKILE